MKLNVDLSIKDLIQEALENQVFIPDPSEDLESITRVLSSLHHETVEELKTMVVEFFVSRREAESYPEKVIRPELILGQISQLETKVADLEELITEAVDSEDALDLEERRYEEARRELITKIKELEVCPLCGSEDGFKEYV